MTVHCTYARIEKIIRKRKNTNKYTDLQTRRQVVKQTRGGGVRPKILKKKRKAKPISRESYEYIRLVIPMKRTRVQDISKNKKRKTSYLPVQTKQRPSTD